MSRLDMGGCRIQETKIPVTELYRPGLHLDQRHPVSSPLCLLFLLDTHIVWGIKLKIKVFIPCLFLMIRFLLLFYTSKI